MKTKKSVLIAAALMILCLLSGCSANEGNVNMPKIGKVKTVGSDIQEKDINDFYYTEENINFDAYYQRYRFYVKDEKHMFFHETRERKNMYGPCTEEDTTKKGTIELDDEQWKKFFELVSGGTVKTREDSAESGGKGPWMYLYLTSDNGDFNEFSFESYRKQQEFEEFCEELASGTS